MVFGVTGGMSLGRSQKVIYEGDAKVSSSTEKLPPTQTRWEQDHLGPTLTRRAQTQVEVPRDVRLVYRGRVGRRVTGGRRVAGGRLCPSDAT